MSPELSPVLNHETRCAEVPCVNLSGITRPVACFCSRSSPTAAAALMAEATSLSSISFRCSVEFPQTPAKQSACSSKKNRKGVRRTRIPLLLRANSSFDAENFLHMVADFVRDHIRLREFAGRAKAVAKFVEKSEIEIHLFVAGTVKRPGRRSRFAARRSNFIPEENQLRRDGNWE